MKNNIKITKAVIAAAGIGTRFLPATKNQPKEMFPIIDRPIIHHLVDELVNSGIKDIILVTRYGSGVLEDYFDNNAELELSLQNNKKQDALKVVQNIPKLANFAYVRQKKHLPYGNGTPLLAAKDLIDDDESFVYMFGDDLTISDVPVTKQLIDVYLKQQPKAILGVQEVAKSEIHKYGSAGYKRGAGYKYEIEALNEKLPADKAPSLMAAFGRYVFSYDVVIEAEKTSTSIGGELWIADMLNNIAKRGEKVIAQPIKGKWLTTGDPLEYIKTILEFAKEDENLKKGLKEYLK